MSTHVRLAADLAQAVAMLAPAQAQAVNGETLRELTAGQAVFELVQEGQVVGAFTLGLHETASGRVMHCAAAAGRGKDLAGTIARFKEHEARRLGVKRLVCETRRRGLVRRLAREGYRVAGYVLTKEI
jgi:hypothetical protein